MNLLRAFLLFTLIALSHSLPAADNTNYEDEDYDDNGILGSLR